MRAQGFTGKTWLQAALLEQGLARVAIAPDRNECAPDLYAAEGRGRAAAAGLWADAAYAPRNPQQVKGSTGSFADAGECVAEGGGVNAPRRRWHARRTRCKPARRTRIPRCRHDEGGLRPR